MRRLLFAVSAGVLLAAVGCGSESDSSGSGGSTSTGGGGGSSAAGGAAGAATGGGAGVGGSSGGSGGTSGTGGTAGTGGAAGVGAIGEWTDAPGACPNGMPKVELTTAAELADASRAEGAYVGDAPATCYFIKNGTYSQSGVLMFIKKGGEAGGQHRVFVGESRDGVVIHGRASTNDGVGDLTVQNLTFDLTGYSAGGSFNTLSLGTGKNITIDHVTFTGDCATGLKGGHIETNGTAGLLVDSCLIEKFGNCASGGHEDHGVYLAGGKNLTITNSVIRQNSSRGIQMYTQGGQYGTLDEITVEHCRIYENGHADYEDGIVINGSGSGTIQNVSITRNLFYENRYSGVRFAGGAFAGISITKNTFANNGQGSSSASRSEVNIDDVGGGANTDIGQNIFAVGNTLINDCYDAAGKGFSLAGNFVSGSVPTGAKGNCVSGVTTGDPQFANAAGGDYHPQNAAAQAFGAYAP